MKLRSQMLLAGALTLTVPIVGWQSVKQLYTALQQTRIDEQTLKVANARLALSEAQDIDTVLESGQLPISKHDWYAESARYPIFVDGYADDWQTLGAPAVSYTAAGDAAQDSTLTVTLRAARRHQRLFLFVTVVDSTVVYHAPPLLRSDAGEGELPNRQTRLINGDAVELLLETSEYGLQHGLFRAIAPGPMRALVASDSGIGRGVLQASGQFLDNWQGVWVNNHQGYQLELELPLPVNGASVALAVVDVDTVGAARTRWAGSMSPERMKALRRKPIASKAIPTAEWGAGRLFHDSVIAADRLATWTTPGVRTRLFDVHGRLVADVNKLYAATGLEEEVANESAQNSAGLWDAILFRVFAFFVAGDLPLLPETRTTPVTLNLDKQRRSSLSDDTPVTSRYVTDENDRVLGTLAPIGSENRRGYLLFESNEEHASAYAGSQLARLFTLLLMVSLLAGSGLLIFATMLSVRIRRLSRQAQHAIAADGRVSGLPGSEARDEIGDLSRKLSSLLSRSAAYTQYLEALSGRLSHELRTPLSVVRTSIENLDRDRLDAETLALIDRASNGADQLSLIIRALVESTRLEQTVQLAEMQLVPMQLWLEGCLERYQQIYPDFRFSIGGQSTPDIELNASPELLQQAFDKLVDNAIGFADSPDIILVMSMEKSDHQPVLWLAVANHGPAIDEALLPRLFDPMFCQRDGRDSGLHLGLGLYIVKMISEAHAGHASVRNQVPWTVVGMQLPLPYT